MQHKIFGGKCIQCGYGAGFIAYKEWKACSGKFSAPSRQTDKRPFTRTMQITFNCPHCNAAIEAESSQAGMAADCPACGQPLHISSSPPPFKLGSYQGTCTNTTGKKPVVSRLTLAVVRQENQTIHGKLTTTGALDVDLEFSGTLTGNQIQFVTTTRNKKLTIEWLAVIQDDSLRGTFSVTKTGFWASVFGTKHQHGEWQCQKERFTFLERLKSIAQGVLGLIVLIAIIGGVIAFYNSDSKSSSPSVAYTPSSVSVSTAREPLQTSYQPNYTPSYNSPSASQQQPTGLDKFVNDHQEGINLAGRAIIWGLQQKYGGSGNTNPSQVWHSNSDGSGGHWQTAPNGNPNDNFSTRGNVNPRTGERGYK